MVGEDSIKYNLKDKKFLIFDAETCNINLALPMNKIWGLSWILTNGYKIVKEQDRYLNWPDLNVSKGAAFVTGFTPDLIVKRGENPETVINDFEADFYNPEYIILGQNILNFDVYLHNISRELLNRPTDYSYIPRCIDIRSLGVAFKIGYKFKKDEDFMAQQYKLLGYLQKGLKTNLTQLCKDFNIEVDETKTHEALYDNQLCFKVFLELIKVLEI